MRTILFALALLTLTACDTAAPADEVVGTWTLSSLTETLRVTSRTAQTVPDLSATPTSTVMVSGPISAALVTVTGISRDPRGSATLGLTSLPPGQPGVGVDLTLFDGPDGASAHLDDGGSGASYYNGFTSGALLTQEGPRFEVGPIALSNGSETVTVRGAVAFPGIALAPDEPTDVQPYDEEIVGTLRFSFEPDGTFAATASGPGASEAVSGTWEAVGDDRVRVTATEQGATETVTFRFAVDGPTLTLETTDYDPDCNAECVRWVEAEVFAAPGSLASVEAVSTLRFGAASGGAAARTAGPRESTAPRRPRVPLFDRF